MAYPIKWFGNDGGPLIVLPREALPFWEGGEVPSNGRIVEAEFRYLWLPGSPEPPATDYDRACDVVEWAKILGVGEHWGVVLVEDATTDAWLRLDNPTAVIARAIGGAQAAISDEDIYQIYASQSGAIWQPLHAPVTVGQGDLLLMHAAESGAAAGSYPQEIRIEDEGYGCIGTALVCRVQPGEYQIESCEVSDEEQINFIFVRFQKIEAT